MILVQLLFKQLKIHSLHDAFSGCFIFITSTLMVSFSFAQNNDPSPLEFPTPKNIDRMLFYLQRDPNTNTVIYALNLQSNGILNSSEPVSAYWIRYGENAEKKDLGYIQRKFAYGLSSKKINKDKYELRFVSHKSLPMYLIKNGKNGSYMVTVMLNNKNIKISRLFIRIVGGSFWVPNVRYALIEGIDLYTEKSVTEIISVK